MMILQPSDITSFDTGLDGPDLLPQEAAEPTAAFADILELGLNNARDVAQIDGIPLPMSGKELPEEPPELPASPAVLPINVLVLQVEPVRSDSQLAPASPVQFIPPTGAGLVAAGSIPPKSMESAVSTSAALDPSGASVSKVPIVSVDVTLQAATERLLSDNPAGAATAALPAPKTAAADDRGVTGMMRNLAAAPNGGAADTEALDNKGLADRTLALQAYRTRQAASGDAAARQGYEDARGELQRNLKIQPGVSTTPAVAQTAVVTARQLETPVAQFSQPGAPAAVSAAMAPASSETGNTATQLTQTIGVPVKDAAWGDRISERVLLMASNRLQSAEIRLSPAELGPLRVQVVIDDGAANVTFLAQHAATREALEQAMPRLRELLAENGLTLNQTNIGEHHEQGVQHGNSEAGDEMTTAADAALDSDDEQGSAESLNAGRAPQRSDGLVDTFA
ncbi:MAG: flagellar hook-length control protein FliK [Gammaproteobacteria bacterium]|nr:flagellar hook-length control protein FliK [Gammaproteobacteria bacterium]